MQSRMSTTLRRRYTESYDVTIDSSAVTYDAQSVMDGWLTTGDQSSLLSPVTSLTGVSTPADVPTVTVTTSQVTL